MHLTISLNRELETGQNVLCFLNPKNHFCNTGAKPKIPALHERPCNELLEGLNEKICVLQRK